MAIAIKRSDGVAGTRVRLFLGALCAALAAASTFVAFLIVSYMIYLPNSFEFNISFVSRLVLGGGVAFLFGLAVVSVGGLPAYFALRRIGWTGPLHFLAAGAAIGLTSYLLTAIGVDVMTQSLHSLVQIRMVVQALLCGAAAGLVFWRIALWRRSEVS